MNPLSLLGYDWNAEGEQIAGPSPKSWTLAGLQGASSTAGMLAQIGATRAAGASAQQSAYMAARDEFMNADQAIVSGVGQVAGLRGQLSQALGARAAAAGASGVDGGQGIVQDNAAAITRSNDVGAGVARSNAEIMARRHRINGLADTIKGNEAGAEASRAARAQLVSGIFGALTSAAMVL